MRELKLPKFKSDEEESDFWDSFDTAQILEKGEQIELEYKPETAIENICVHCGERGDNNPHQGLLLPQTAKNQG